MILTDACLTVGSQLSGKAEVQAGTLCPLCEQRGSSRSPSCLVGFFLTHAESHFQLFPVVVRRQAPSVGTIIKCLIVGIVVAKCLKTLLSLFVITCIEIILYSILCKITLIIPWFSRP